MAWADDLAAAADDLFALAGEEVEYSASAARAIPVTVSAIVRGLTPNDMISEHVLADAVICEIREADLIAAQIDEPARGDTIERPMPYGVQTLEVVDRYRDQSGIWRLFCQANIRVTP